MMRYLSRFYTDPLVSVLAVLVVALAVTLALAVALDFDTTTAHAVVSHHTVVLAPTVNGIKSVPPDYHSAGIYNPWPGHSWGATTICDPTCHTTVSVSP